MNLDYLFYNYKFSSNFLKNYINHPGIRKITIIETQKLSLQFIKKYIDLFLYRNKLFCYQNLSEKFILENFKISTIDIYSLLDNKNNKCNIYKLCKKANINFKDINWGNLSKKLTKLAMAYDAQHHSKPELFDEWAKGGECPYSWRHMLGNIRQLKFMEERSWWQPKLKTIKLPTDNQLFKMLIDCKRKELFKCY